MNRNFRNYLFGILQRKISNIIPIHCKVVSDTFFFLFLFFFCLFVFFPLFFIFVQCLIDVFELSFFDDHIIKKMIQYQFVPIPLKVWFMVFNSTFNNISVFRGG
jgi:hypothetical protein